LKATPLSAYVNGVGLLGPGIANWASGAEVLGGRRPWVRAPTVLPPPEGLPAAERRRTGTVVKLALAVGFEATRHAGADPAQLPAVFSSSGGDGENCHEICQVLASPERQLSPTRFHNSVHNAAAGYWSIATGATPASNSLCAYDGSFAAGLLEALTQLASERAAVLLIAYDVGYPQPLRAARPIPDAFAVAMVLSPQAGPAALSQIEAHLSDAPADTLDEPLEDLRRAIPAARSLPLLALLARGRAGGAVLEYLDHARVAVTVSPCR
jgi:hypothetical protein